MLNVCGILSGDVDFQFIMFYTHSREKDVPSEGDS